MKVVLTKDVRNMGRAGSVIEVSDGHAINFLFPRKLAIPATAQNLKNAEVRQKQAEDHKALTVELLKQNIKTLNEAHVVLKKKANEKGHLYEAVGVPEIILAAKQSAGVDLPETAIHLDKPFKEVGTHEIKVGVGKESGTFTLIIEAA